MFQQGSDVPSGQTFARTARDEPRSIWREDGGSSKLWLVLASSQFRIVQYGSCVGPVAVESKKEWVMERADHTDSCTRTMTLDRNDLEGSSSLDVPSAKRFLLPSANNAFLAADRSQDCGKG